MRTKLISVIALAAVLLIFASCGAVQEDPEQEIDAFLTALIEDDQPLQEMLMQNVEVIGIGVEPVDHSEAQAEIDDYLRARFEGLFSEQGMEEALKKGSLSLYQTYLALASATAELDSLTVNKQDSQSGAENYTYEAQITCRSGEEEERIPVRGYVYFDDQLQIDRFSFDQDYTLEEWLFQHASVAPES